MKDIRRHLIALTAVIALWVGLAAAHPQPRVNVVTVQIPPANGVTSRSGRVAPSTSSTATGSCQGLSPGPDWTCANGTWQLASLVGADGTGSGAGGAGGCQGAQPGANYTCQGGVWQPASGSTAATAAPSTTSTNPATGCLATPPTPDWVCQLGIWTPPPAQAATATTGSASAAGGTTSVAAVNSAGPGTDTTMSSAGAGSATVSGSGTATSGCASPSPGPNYVCQSGVWTLR